jgi:hypothetical protein
VSIVGLAPGENGLWRSAGPDAPEGRGRGATIATGRRFSNDPVPP